MTNIEKLARYIHKQNIASSKFIAIIEIKKIIEILDIDADYLLGIEKTSSSDNSDEEASVQNIIEELTNLFVRSGYIEPGGDLTDDQLRFCIGVIDMFNAYFEYIRFAVSFLVPG